MKCGSESLCKTYLTCRTCSEQSTSLAYCSTGSINRTRHHLWELNGVCFGLMMKAFLANIYLILLPTLSYGHRWPHEFLYVAFMLIRVKKTKEEFPHGKETELSEICLFAIISLGTLF